MVGRCAVQNRNKLLARLSSQHNPDLSIKVALSSSCHTITLLSSFAGQNNNNHAFRSGHRLSEKVHHLVGNRATLLLPPEKVGNDSPETS